MKNSLNRLEYIYYNVAPEQYLETFWPFIRYRSELFDVDYIKKQVRQKTTEGYKNYVFREYSGNDLLTEYMPKGFCYTEITLEKEDLIVWGKEQLDDKPLVDEAKEYLINIIDLCKQEGIELVLFSAPMYELQLLTLENYDAYIKQIEEIGNEYGVAYYDFNLVKSDYFQIQDSENFYDMGHLNYKGADLFTEFFCEVMKETKENRGKYFYKSYKEKKKMEKGRVYGFYSIDEDMYNMKWEIVSNWDEGMEYRILMTPEGGNTSMVQDFSKDNYVSIRRDTDGICTVVSRRIGEPDSVSTFEISY